MAKGSRVGGVGLGGLGHMGVKLAHTLGAHVTLFTTSSHTTSSHKTEDAERLGADEVVVTKDTTQMKKHANRFDFILDTVSA